MLRVGISGASGRLGLCLLQQATAAEDIQVSAAFVSNSNKHLGKDISCLLGGSIQGIAFTAANEYQEGQDSPELEVVVDFSLPAAFDALVDNCVMAQVPLVSGTTGLSQEQFDRLQQASKFIPVLWTSNFSLNIQMIKNLLNILSKKNTVKKVHITETHHVHKQDMPSGTAISLAQEMTSAPRLIKKDDHVFTLGDITIESVRQGETPGTHAVNIALEHENITIEHESKTPALFAAGALQVARWIIDKPAGLYSLNDVLLS